MKKNSLNDTANSNGLQEVGDVDLVTKSDYAGGSVEAMNSSIYIVNSQNKEDGGVE